ncbi:uncharacterized protein LOC113295162 [Papaver somniferum]|uniref:uncharacterized protein LOC113295162 n=1 Tax=Papaver somniferum TaxID=3469 RepID=UPI000E6FBDAD|nr:uncharacterized protein LOC113295162 [Papaver somniferum]
MSCNSEPRTYPCTICGDQSHTGPQCPLFYPTETTRDQVSVLHGGMNSKFEGRPKFDPYSNTYNPGWRHNPNFSWSKGSQQGGPSSNPPPDFHRNQTQFQEPSPVDHKLTSLEESMKLLAQSVVQSNQKFDDFVLMSQRNQQNNSQAISNLETQISQLSNRSDKTLENSVEPPKDKSPAEKENEVDQTSSKDLNGPESFKSPSEEDIPERVYIPPAPFSQRLAKKKPSTYAEILDIFKQVKINLPLLNAIKHVPAMEKFLKEMCTIKRDVSVHKKEFLTQQVSSIISQKYPVKFKDPGCPTVTCVIGSQKIENALLDLGASVNLLPFWVYEQLGLGEMKPTRITPQLADRSVKIPRGIIEDVLV